MANKTVIAVCGKGGVGKTVLSGSLTRVLVEQGHRVLAVDADPAMGLSYILGLQNDVKTLGNVKDNLIAKARNDRKPDEIAGMIDYLLLEALYEMDKFSFLAMGRSQSKGCFCPLNTLLKESIYRLAQNYDVVVVDAEAGLEQLNREVMSFVDKIVILVDGSRRSEYSMEIILKMVQDLNMKAKTGIVLNRWRDKEIKDVQLSENAPVWGIIPEDIQLLQNDAGGNSIFKLPSGSAVLQSVNKITKFLLEELEV